MNYNSSTDLDASIIIQLENLVSGHVSKKDIANPRELIDFSKTLNVKPYTSYSVSMRLCIDVLCSAFSDPFKFKTMEGKPSPVRNVHHVEKDGQVEITWDRPINISGVIQNYSVLLRNAKNEILPRFPVTIKKNTQRIILKNLPLNQELSVTITPYTSFKGEKVTYTFRSPEGRPSIPNKVNAVALDKGDIIAVRWKQPLQPNGVITGYKVSWTGRKVYDPTFLEKKEHQINETKGVEEFNKFSITNLTPGTAYDIFVSARTSKGYGKPKRVSQIFNTPATGKKLLSCKPAEMLKSNSEVVRICWIGM